VLVAVSKGMRAVKLHQQNPPVLKWGCQLTCIMAVKMVVVVVLFDIKALQNFVYFHFRLTVRH